MIAPISPPPALGPRGDDLPAYVSNGLIGLRLKEVPILPGVCVVNGIVGEHPEKRIEAVARLPYPLAADIAVGDARLSEQPWTVSNLDQRYDFAAGEVTSRFDSVLAGTRLRVTVLTFASRSHPTILCQEIAIAGADAVQLSISANVDTAGIRGHAAARHVGLPGEPDSPIDGTLLWTTEGDLAQCGIAVSCDVTPPGPKDRRRPIDSPGPLNTSVTLDRPSGTVRLRQIASLVPSLLHERPDQEAARRLGEALRIGFDDLRKRNRTLWRGLWKSRPVVNDGDFAGQALIDAGFFYLNCSVHETSPAATGIFGLAFWPDYHYYYGHVMWDIDAFCVPTLLLSQPRAARAILEYRERGIPAARSNAKLSGTAGLQYPWEAGAISCEETTPGEGSAAAHELHISMHVARAFSLFDQSTGEPGFAETSAWPVLHGVADWICDRVEWNGPRAHFREASGIAEVPEPPDDDTFTIVAAKDALRRAIALAARLGQPCPEPWSRTERALEPIVRSDGALAAHADFRIDEEKGTTPGPLAALFPYDYTPTRAVEQATLELFLSRWKDYVGSPMLPAFYPLWAARMGDRKLAATLFDEAYGAYHRGRFRQCLEYRPDHPESKVPAGPFFANIGAMMSALTFGFTGLSIDDGDPAAWPKRLVVLPQGWTSIAFDQVWIRGKPARLVARHGAERATLTF